MSGPSTSAAGSQGHRLHDGRPGRGLGHRRPAATARARILDAGSDQAVFVDLLEDVGGRKEVAEYLRHYRSVDSQRFAIVTVLSIASGRSANSSVISIGDLK